MGYFFMKSRFQVLVFCLLIRCIRPTEMLNICLVLEEDSFYATYNRLQATLDLAVTHANAFILPKSTQIQVTYIPAGPSCTQMQYSVISNVMKMLSNGTRCHIFLGAGCATTALSLYGIADSLNIALLAIPGVGVPVLALNSSEIYFRLLIRPAFGFADLADFVQALFARYNYTHVTFFRDDTYGFFSLFSRTLVDHFRTTDIVLFQNSLEIPFFSAGVEAKEIDRMLNDAAVHSRVIFLLTHAKAARQIMLRAYNRGMTNGEYVYIAAELYELDYWGKIQYSVGDTSDMDAKNAFSSLTVLALHEDSGTKYQEEFEDQMKRLAINRYNYSFNPLQNIDPVIISHYESIIMYAQEVKKMAVAGLDFKNGTLLTARICGSTYNSIIGTLIIGQDGIRNRDYEMRFFDASKGEFEVVLWRETLTTSKDSFHVVRILNWPSVQGQLPPDEPHCGFVNNKCKENRFPRGVLAVAVIVPLLFFLALVGSVACIFVKLRNLREDYNPDWWKINTQLELVIKQGRAGSEVSKRTMQLPVDVSAFTVVISGLCRGTAVSLLKIVPLVKHPTQEMMSKFNLLKRINHPNLQKFIGIGLSNDGVCEYIVGEFCSKGSVSDILHNELVKLDWIFKNSLIKDIVLGMENLHSTTINSHGNLNSHTCLIDARFTLKISDYGCPFFRDPADLAPAVSGNPDRQYHILLWRAPELLRQIMPPQGSQKGDVYSFAIILQQIILRSGPFELPGDPLEMSDNEIVLEVATVAIPPVRPRVPRSACSNELYDLMEHCWEEIPLERPTFLKIKEKLRKVIGDVGDNIVDLLFKRMEQYANDLELKVAEKTQQFMDEKYRSEQLLCQLLPKPVAAALTHGQQVDPESYESVTVFFSDIVDFTTISAAGTPMDVVSLLNNLYTFFDGILEKYDVYKVETSGDAYMVCSGLPVRNGNRHVAEIASMSIELMKGITGFVVPHLPGERVQVRIGINSGPCVAGIVGLKMPRYCLFGDTVNVASRMESTGEPMKIQISQASRDLLESIGGFVTTERGPIIVKGKGVLVTYWLIPF